MERLYKQWQMHTDSKSWRQNALQLYVEIVPAGATKQELVVHLNAAMDAMGFWTTSDPPVISCNRLFPAPPPPPPPPTAAPAAAAPPPSYAAYAGRRPGCVYTTRNGVTGYYADAAAATAAADPEEDAGLVCRPRTKGNKS